MKEPKVDYSKLVVRDVHFKEAILVAGRTCASAENNGKPYSVYVDYSYRIVTVAVRSETRGQATIERSHIPFENVKGIRYLDTSIEDLVK